MNSISGRRIRSATSAPATPNERRLRYAALIFAASLLLHNGDHLRRGWDAVTREVRWSGSLALALSVTAIVLALRRHRLAPATATVVGFAMALGVTAVHLLPQWTAFNDSLPEGAVDWFTWVAVFGEIGGALLFGAAGLAALRRTTRPRPIDGATPTTAR